MQQMQELTRPRSLSLSCVSQRLRGLLLATEQKAQGLGGGVLQRAWQGGPRMHWRTEVKKCTNFNAILTKLKEFRKQIALHHHLVPGLKELVSFSRSAKPLSPSIRHP